MLSSLIERDARVARHLARALRFAAREESHPHRREDANTFVYAVKVPARGETKIKYTVRVRWC